MKSHHHHVKSHHLFLMEPPHHMEATIQHHHPLQAEIVQAPHIILLHQAPHIILLHQHHQLLQEVVTTILHQLHMVAPQHQSSKPRQSAPPLHPPPQYLHLHSSLILIHPSLVHASKLLYFAPAKTLNNGERKYEYTNASLD